jgi:hypothetical protein
VKIEDLGLINQDVDTFTDLARKSEEAEMQKKETARLSSILKDQETQLTRLVSKYA